jgi:hypothetical protein
VDAADQPDGDEAMAPEKKATSERSEVTFPHGGRSPAAEAAIEVWASLAIVGAPLMALCVGALWSYPASDGPPDDPLAPVREVCIILGLINAPLAAAMLPALRMKLPGRRWMILGVGLPIFGLLFLGHAGLAAGLYSGATAVERAVGTRLRGSYVGTRSGTACPRGRAWDFWLWYLERHDGGPEAEEIATGMIACELAGVEFSRWNGQPRQRTASLVTFYRANPARRAFILQRLFSAAQRTDSKGLAEALQAEGFTPEAVLPP